MPLSVTHFDRIFLSPTPPLLSFRLLEVSFPLCWFGKFSFFFCYIYLVTSLSFR